MIKNERFFSLLLREIVFVFVFSSLSLSRFSHQNRLRKIDFLFHKKKHREQQFKSRHFPPPLLQSSSSGFLYYCIQHTHTRNIIRTTTNQYTTMASKKLAQTIAHSSKEGTTTTNEERHLTNFEKSSPVENYRPSVGPGVAKRPGFCGGLSRESAGVVPARERQDTKLGTRSRV